MLVFVFDLFMLLVVFVFLGVGGIGGIIGFLGNSVVVGFGGLVDMCGEFVYK